MTRLLWLLPILLAVPRPAAACECAPAEVELRPAPGAAGVPTSTRVVMPQRRVNPSFVLWGPGGGVPGGITAVDAGTRTLIFTPEAPLRPHTRYEITGADVPWSFTTGEGPDRAAPAVPTVTAREERVEPELAAAACGPRFEVGLSTAHDGDYLLVDVGGTARFVPEALAGEVALLREGRTARVGLSACLDTWPEAAPGARTTVRLAALDGSGNFSGWSEPVVLDLAPRGDGAPVDGGCATGAGAPWLALLTLATARASGARSRPRPRSCAGESSVHLG